MKVKLNKKDWEQALSASVDLLKNSLAQVEVYKLQVDMAEKKIAGFPEKKPKKVKSKKVAEKEKI